MKIHTKKFNDKKSKLFQYSMSFRVLPRLEQNCTNSTKNVGNFGKVKSIRMCAANGGATVWVTDFPQNLDATSKSYAQYDFRFNKPIIVNKI